ncbi:MAG: (deoxy)nucleoside triphosphate pyrophosphohydrolase [Clostridiales Family XIII bacterium]|jgi:8-oxo-dGTP diphosphatase|nr:(deoxy)nucleoside triphosphate pyrophosphohydrolase [Clostridiales Family XIII bacterium]
MNDWANEKNRKTIHVAAAVIVEGGAILAVQRGYGGYAGWWEFPGGKVEPGEAPEAALAREIKEELDADIRVGRLLATVEWDYPEFHLVMDCFLCAAPGRITLLEHSASAWLGRGDLYSVKWLAADYEVLKLVEGLL